MCLIPSSVHTYHLTSELSQIFFPCAQIFDAHCIQREPSRAGIATAEFSDTGPLPSSRGAVANVPWQNSQLARCLRSSRYHAPSSSTAAAEFCRVSPTLEGSVAGVSASRVSVGNGKGRIVLSLFILQRSYRNISKWWRFFVFVTI